MFSQTRGFYSHESGDYFNKLWHNSYCFYVINTRFSIRVNQIHISLTIIFNFFQKFMKVIYWKQCGRCDKPGNKVNIILFLKISLDYFSRLKSISNLFFSFFLFIIFFIFHTFQFLRVIRKWKSSQLSSNVGKTFYLFLSHAFFLSFQHVWLRKTISFCEIPKKK